MNGNGAAGTENKPLWLELPGWGRWGGILLFNSAVALFLTAIGFGGPLPSNWLFSQCIGLTIFLAVEIVLHRMRAGTWRTVALFASVVVGSALGTLLAIVLAGAHRVDDILGPMFWQAAIIGLLFGSGFVVFSGYRERALLVERDLHEERLKHLSADKARVETELRALQAQVEPHFLFNTLAIVRGLITSDPVRGRELLDHLIDYLRATLSHNRREHASLGEEIELLSDYLTIMRFRMGERLAFRIDVPQALRSLPFPPMLLQPLVENAIRHGLEPKAEPGTLTIQARVEAGRLVVDVIDDGIGFGTQPGGSGTGLANVRDRLLALYDGQAKLTVHENTGGGVTAALTVPES